MQTTADLFAETSADALASGADDGADDGPDDGADSGAAAPATAGAPAGHRLRGPLTIRLKGPTDWAGFVRSARALLRASCPPDAVSWIWAADQGEGDASGGAGDGRAESAGAGLDAGLNAGLNADLFATANAATTLRPGDLPDGPPLNLPSAWVETARSAALHADAQRHMLIYRSAWQLHRQPVLVDDPLDADRRRLDHMAHAVRREAHKMKAFVRFRPVADGDGVLRHIAWFEPEHHVQEKVAPFFMRRFAQMHWLILTPRLSIGWDGERLVHGPGGRRDQAPQADDGEALWLAYYRSIFNPARVKLAMMKREMPVRFWRNLPETQQIGHMVQAAQPRVGRMLAQPLDTERERPRGQAVNAMVAELPSRVAAREADDLTGPAADAGLVGVATSAPLSLADRDAAWQRLAAQARRCTGCALAGPATQTVFGEGALDARVMLVGEQPGDQEDLAGRPFVGPAGQLLRRTLAGLGWAERRLYLSNAVKHFGHALRGKRRIHKTAGQREAAACLDWLEAEIALVQPELIIALGATAARSLLGRPVAVSDAAGPWWTRADGRTVLVVLHPAAILRSSADQRPAAEAAWRRALGQVEAAWVNGSGGEGGEGLAVPALPG